MQKNFRTFDIAIQFHDKTERLKLSGHLKDQLLRASSSIALNLSEGNAKPSVKEKKRYYQTAYASLKECETIFQLAKIEDENLLKDADHLGACLYKLTRADLRIDPSLKIKN
jgi:four helix bundle protein